MAMGGGTFVVLGTTVVAVLAVAAAVGADAVAGTPHKTPGVDIAMSDDFCTLMGDLKTYFAANSADVGVLAGTIDLNAGEDPGVLDGIREDAGPTLEVTATMAAYLDHGADVVSDATVAEALRTTGAYVKDLGETIARISRDATSVEGFVTAISGIASDPSDQQAATDANAAGDTITDYVTTECAIDISAVFGAESSGDPADASVDPANAVKTDASTLGKDIATAFVDWIEGDPPPTVDLADGMYGVTTSSTSDGGTSFSSSYFSAASTDPAIIDQAIFSPTDWCVSVTDNAAATPTTYRYSATGGLEEGTCAALATAT